MPPFFAVLFHQPFCEHPVDGNCPASKGPRQRQSYDGPSTRHACHHHAHFGQLGDWNNRSPRAGWLALADQLRRICAAGEGRQCVERGDHG